MNTHEKEHCLEVIKKHQIKTNYYNNLFMSFLGGGIIAVIGQSLIYLYSLIGLENDICNALMSSTLIIIASILTGFGLYDKIGQKYKAGAFIPITGFANCMTSSALEYKSEGLVKGIAANMFKLAGSVIVFGVLSAFFFGMVRYLVGLI